MAFLFVGVEIPPPTLSKPLTSKQGPLIPALGSVIKGQLPPEKAHRVPSNGLPLDRRMWAASASNRMPKRRQVSPRNLTSAN